MVFARDGTAHILDFEMGCQAVWFSPEMVQSIFWILRWDVKLYGFRPSLSTEETASLIGPAPKPMSESYEKSHCVLLRAPCSAGGSQGIREFDPYMS